MTVALCSKWWQKNNSAPTDEHPCLHPSEVELGENCVRGNPLIMVREKANPDRVVIDSLSELRPAAPEPRCVSRKFAPSSIFFASQMQR